MADEPLFISAVKQKSFVDVNEEGTEAAAVTNGHDDAVWQSWAPVKPFEMIVDRPFFFVIGDDQTQSILFMGVVYDPTGQRCDRRTGSRLSPLFESQDGSQRHVMTVFGDGRMRLRFQTCFVRSLCYSKPREQSISLGRARLRQRLELCRHRRCRAQRGKFRRRSPSF